MNKLAASLLGSLLAGMLAIGGCGSGGDDSSTTAPAPAFNTSGVATGTPGTGTSGTGTTPGGQVVLVRLGTDNLIESDPPLYRKLWVAIVTDTAGNPLPGVTVTFAMRSGSLVPVTNTGFYEKGAFVKPAIPPVPTEAQVWRKSTVAGVGVVCGNEDGNYNAILDPLEDINGNGLLDPPGIVDVNPTAVSDASGIARATLTYPKNYARWATMTLEARSGAGVPAIATFELEGLAADYADLTVSPPGQISPFGTGNLCTNTL